MRVPPCGVPGAAQLRLGEAGGGELGISDFATAVPSRRWWCLAEGGSDFTRGREAGAGGRHMLQHLSSVCLSPSADLVGGAEHSSLAGEAQRTRKGAGSLITRQLTDCVCCVYIGQAWVHIMIIRTHGFNVFQEPKRTVKLMSH